MKTGTIGKNRLRPGCLILLLSAAICQPLTAQTNSDDPAVGAWQRVQSLYQTFDQNYFRPVAKQQFMLVAVHSCYAVADRQPPEQLRYEVAQLTSDAELEKWLTTHWRAALEGIDEDPDRPLLDRVSNRLLQQLDPGAGYASANDNRVQEQLAENQYVGIGIRVRFEDDKALIDYPFPGGTAHQAGARVGDFILEVDGESMEGLNLGVIVQRLRGLEGSSVSVVVQNKDGSEARTLDMIRKVIPIPSVTGLRQYEDGTWEFMADEGGRHAYMAISSLVGSTSAELRDAVRKVADAGAEGVVLDLRQLTDADLHHLNMVADVLIGQGELGTLRLPDGQTRQLETRADSAFENMPIAVLTGQRVSGPVFALLNALGQRERTALIGPVTTSALSCLDSFELPDGDGAIQRLPYAILIPAGKAASSGYQHLQVEESGLARLPVDEELTSGDPLAAAQQWLDQQ